jgi:UDP-GlcNAc:undecaprenyl-phosphate GlcNAc-1-phosphate transferase
MMLLCTLFGAGLAGAAVLVPTTGRLARRFGLYEQPKDDRWHDRPVPKLGGVAMLLAFALVLSPTRVLAPLGPLLVCVALMSAVGLVDDLRPIRARTKLALQLAVAMLLVFLYPPIQLTGDVGADRVIGVVWIVGITNAFNLLDNIDGLAAGVAAIAGTGFLIVARLGGGPLLDPIAGATAAFVGVMLGFLLYNFQPASIFMGDSGSHLIGSFLAGAMLLATPTIRAPFAPAAAIPIVLLLVPMFDTALVTLTRVLAGRSPFSGGRDHTSHRLVALGMPERRAVLVLYTLTGLGGCLAVALLTLRPGVVWGFGALYVTALGLMGLYLAHIGTSTDRLGPAFAPLPSELASRYRIYEVLLDTLLVGGAYYAAFALRFHGTEVNHFLPYFAQSLPLVVGTQVLALWLAGKYRQVWRTPTADELYGLLRAILLGLGVSVIATLYLDRFEGYSRSVFAFDALLAPTLIILSRVTLGALDERLRRRRSHGRTALVYGAGRCGALAVRELLQNASLGLTPVGFIDDDPAKKRLRLDGLRVLGSLDDLPAMLEKRDGRVSAMVVSIDKLSAERFRRVCDVCDAHGVSVRRVRFALEDVDWRDRTSGVVRFPGP